MARLTPTPWWPDGHEDADRFEREFAELPPFARGPIARSAMYWPEGGGMKHRYPDRAMVAAVSDRVLQERCPHLGAKGLASLRALAPRPICPHCHGTGFAADAPPEAGEA